MSKGKFLLVCMIWLTLFGIGAAAWRLIVTPMRQSAEEAQQRQANTATLEATQGELPYAYEVNLALDSFSGYAVLRSDRFSQLLRQQQIKLNLIDDGANYGNRLEGLRSGKTQMAAFTVDALIKASAEANDFPATIVSLIDETAGADAMVASKSTIANVDDLNQPDVRFVLTPDSPSETLARVVMDTFALDQLPDDPFVFAQDAADVVAKYQRSTKDSRQVYVLWEPFVSKILANDSMHIIIDSSRFTGYIVDCLVAERDFLVKRPDVARKVIECYFRALYDFRKLADRERLVLRDAGADDSINTATAAKLVSGIRWKNTQDNLAHFGLRESSGAQHIADIIENITGVLVKTGAIATDPTDDQPNRFYYDKLLRQLSEDGFHPGDEAEEVEIASELPELNESQWESLVPVGTLDVADLVFPRGTALLTDASQATLDELIEKLRAWPQYYVIIRGNASRLGDLSANQALAKQRAEASQDYLMTHGISPRRIRAVGVEPSGVTKVTFSLGQMPY